MSGFHERLRTIRKEKGYTQEQIAKAIGVTKSTMAKYDRGDLEPNIDKIIKIAQFLDVPVDRLLGTEDDVNEMHTTLMYRCREIALKYGFITDNEYNVMTNSEILNAMEIRKAATENNMELFKDMLSAFVESHALTPQNEQKIADALKDGSFDKQD